MFYHIPLLDYVPELTAPAEQPPAYSLLAHTLHISLTPQARCADHQSQHSLPWGCRGGGKRDALIHTGEVSLLVWTQSLSD